MICQLMVVMCRVRLLAVATIMGVAVVRRIGVMMGNRFWMGVVSMGGDLKEIHERKDKYEDHPKCLFIMSVVPPHGR